MLLVLRYFNRNVFKHSAFAGYTVVFLHLFGNDSAYVLMMTNSVLLQTLEAEMNSSWNL